ncbi:MAG: S26 family signal peptidase [Oscillospiraceae bacterium]|nr:S26 family signal peptidase [Oscillospiraceae bacterium]
MRYGRSQDFCVPEGHLFFLGDNRPFSIDSRFWDNPYMPIENIIAQASYTILPRITSLGLEENCQPPHI